MKIKELERQSYSYHTQKNKKCPFEDQDAEIERKGVALMMP